MVSDGLLGSALVLGKQKAGKSLAGFTGEFGPLWAQFYNPFWQLLIAVAARPPQRAPKAATAM
jgi:hypothetical protein